jgi:uncharacterized protein with HEPN domain
LTAQRNLFDLLADLEEAVDAARELVSLGRERWQTERPLRLAGEAVIGRIGDVASKLPDEVIEETSEVPWSDVKGMRIVVDHVYHAVDYNIVWETLRDDMPKLAPEGRRSSKPRPAGRSGRAANLCWVLAGPVGSCVAERRNAARPRCELRI